jgi:hypothetical protein
MVFAASLALTLAGWGCALEPEETLDDEPGEGTSNLGPAALFEISVSPGSHSVGQGDSAFYSFDVTPLQSFEGNVALEVSSDPTLDAFVSLFPTVVTPPDNGFLDIFTSCETAVGDYAITLTGIADDGTIATGAATLTIQSAATQPQAAFHLDGQNELTILLHEVSSTGFCDPVVAWLWDLGDGTTSTEPGPLHTYASRGDYTVTLTVTTASGLSDTVSQTITVFPGPFPLSIVRVSRNPATFQFSVDLAWSDAEGALVRLFRNFSEVDVPDNDGAVRDQFRTTVTTDFTWELCELEVDRCSNRVSLSAGPGAAVGDPISVRTIVDGRETVQTLLIEDGSED